jgi:hypothetical protein
MCTVHCPVHPRTEGNQSLPNVAPTAPRFLEAIKGTRMRMEHYTKHLLIILRHWDTATTLLLWYIEIQALVLSSNSVALFLVLLSRLVCVRYCNFVYYVCFYSPLLLCSLKINCVRCEISNCGDSSQRDIIEIKGESWYLSWSLDHLKWLSATLVH